MIKDDSKLGDKSDWNLENVEILGIKGNGILKLDNGKKPIIELKLQRE